MEGRRRRRGGEEVGHIKGKGGETEGRRRGMNNV